MIQWVCQMTVLKTLSILCCSARNTLSTELCYSAKFPPFANLTELIVIHWTTKSSSFIYCMATMSLKILQIRTFSPQQSFTSTLQTDLLASMIVVIWYFLCCLFFLLFDLFFSFSFLYFSLFYLIIFIFNSFSEKGFIPTGVKNIARTYTKFYILFYVPGDV